MKRRTTSLLVITGVIGVVLFVYSAGYNYTRIGKGKLTRLTLHHNGIERLFFLYTPRKAQKNPPLLIALHGGGGTALGMVRLTRGRFNELAERDGALVVYPQGLRKHWNDFRDDPIDYAHRKKIDDTGFISVLIKKMIKKFSVNRDRVCVTGMSNGGFMTLRLACELSTQIRGAAIVAATLPQGAEKLCVPQKPVTILIFNGTEDPLVPYNGGYVTVFNKRRGKILSTEQTIALWKKADQCAATPVVRELPDSDPGDGTRVILTTFTPCRGNARVALYTIRGGGHTWPGGDQYFSERLIGKTCRDIKASEIIWGLLNAVDKKF